MAKHASIPAPSPSAAVEDYLKAIWLLGHPEVVRTNAVAERLGVSPASVTGMLSKLDKLDLVRYTRYQGVCLTETGCAEALRLVRRHRLLETFLTGHLGYTWDVVHQEAETLEHAVSDCFTERLAAFLGNPRVDPHGDPIPQADGALPDTPNIPLTELREGEGFRVHRLKTQEGNLLAHFASLGLIPGQSLTVCHYEPVTKLLHLKVIESTCVLAVSLADLVRGEVLT